MFTTALKMSFSVKYTTAVLLLLARIKRQAQSVNCVHGREWQCNYMTRITLYAFITIARSSNAGLGFSAQREATP